MADFHEIGAPLSAKPAVCLRRELAEARTRYRGIGARGDTVAQDRLNRVY